MDELRLISLTKQLVYFLKHVETPAEKYKAVICGVETVEEGGTLRDIPLEGTQWIFNYAKSDLDNAVILIRQIEVLTNSGISISAILEREILLLGSQQEE